jgi:hypothetical protein
MSFIGTALGLGTAASAALTGGIVAGAGSLIGGMSAADAQKSASNTASNAQKYATDKSIEEQRREFDLAQQMLAPYNQLGQNAMPGIQQMLGMGTNGQFTPQTLNVQVPKEYQGLFKDQTQDLTKQLQSDAAAMHLTGTPFLTAEAKALSNLGNQQNAIGYDAGLQRATTERNMNYGGLLDLLNIGSGKAAQGAGLAQQTGQGISNAYQNQGNNLSNIALNQGNNTAAYNMYMGSLPGQMMNSGMNAYGMYNLFNTGGGGGGGYYGGLGLNTNTTAGTTTPWSVYG